MYKEWYGQHHSICVHIMHNLAHPALHIRAKKDRDGPRHSICEHIRHAIGILCTLHMCKQKRVTTSILYAYLYVCAEGHGYLYVISPPLDVYIYSHVHVQGTISPAPFYVYTYNVCKYHVLHSACI